MKRRPPTPLELARFLHEKYEELAPAVGWETQPATRVPFEKLPEANRNLMLAVAAVALEYVVDGIAEEGQAWR